MGNSFLPSPPARSFKRLGLILTTFVVALLLLGATLAAPAQAVGYSAEEVAFLQLINDYRAGLGLGTLQASDLLSDSADKHNSDMGKYGFFSHYTVDSDWFSPGASPWDRMAACGYDFNTWMGENIAAGYTTAEKVFIAWKNSPNHNENMVNPDFTVVGISLVYVAGSTYRYYWTTDFGGHVDQTAHALSPAPTTTTTAAPTTTTTARVTTTTTTAYVPPTTTTTVYVRPSTTTTTFVPRTTTTTTAQAAPSFSDVGGSTLYADQIWLMAASGVVTGYGNGRFGPYDKVTRQQFAKMIVLSLGYAPAAVSACSFKDVATVSTSSDPLYPAGYIAACAAAGITVGKTPYTFCPYDQITRAQLITMVARAACLGDAPSWYQPPFSNFSAEHYPWARGAAYAGLLDGFVGMGPTFNFWAPATRGEVCLLLANLLGR